MRTVFGPKGGSNRRLQNSHIEELRFLWFLPNIIRVIQSSKKRWYRHWNVWGEEKYIQDFGGEI
jgi:hypothetical protein